MEDLRERLEASEARIRQLEEELDLLAFDNERLRAEIKELQQGKPKSGYPAQEARTANPSPDGPKKLMIVNEGDKKFPNVVRRRFDNVCGGSNVLAVKYASVAGREAILCCGADRSVRCIDADSGSPIFSFVMTGPVLSIASRTYPMASSSAIDGAPAEAILVVAAAMDGSVVIARWPTAALRRGEPIRPPAALQQHGKYVVDARVSPDGTLVATASHDKSVNIYGISDHDDDIAAVVDEDGESWMKSKAASSGRVAVNGVCIDLRQRLRFESVPESLAFVRPAGQSSLFLLVALRDSCSLALVNTSSLAVASLSLNENEWDTHVSFNALHLAVGPDAATVAVSTDRDMHLVLRLEWRAESMSMGSEGAGEGGRVVASRLHTLSGLTCGEYGKPRTSWDPTGSYLLSNSQNDYGIHVFDVGLERVVAAVFGGGPDKRQQQSQQQQQVGAGLLPGHRAAVRDVCCHGSRRTALSCGGDGAVIEWHRDTE